MGDMSGRYAVSAHAEICHFYKLCTQFVRSPLYTAGYTQHQIRVDQAVGYTQHQIKVDQAVGYTQPQIRVGQHLLKQPRAFSARFQCRATSPVSSMRGRNPKR